MHKIQSPKDYEVTNFDGVRATGVYIGGLTQLDEAKLEWRREYMSMIGETWELLSLEEIKQQLVKKYGPYVIITVIVEAPLHGEILQYGNYGDEWWQIGEYAGYA